MLFTLIFPFILHAIKSSIVNDESRQQGVYVRDYCPKTKYCAEGTHVMCMYYNPDKVFGPRCSNPRNISMTPILAERLLEVANTIRSKIARGTEKGKHGVFLPRGYGIFRLSWDKELATFAQVLANVCILKHDMCRATKRFPDPGQTAGMARFTYPDWSVLSKSTNISKPGLTDEKLLYAVTQALKSWYSQKSAIDKEMISNYPDWVEHPKLGGRLYLEMIYGSATHMGCGISAYTDYSFFGTAGTNYNSVQIVCNFSARPRAGCAVYNTVPPGDTETSVSKCGCPYGSEEDNECLCVNKRNEEKCHTLSKNCNDASCDPTVVVLPIFTMEDTPPDHLFTSIANHSLNKSVEVGASIFGKLHENNLRRYDSKKYSNAQTRRFNTIQQTDKKVSVTKRNYDKKEVEYNPVDTKYSRQSMMPSKHVQRKSSIFTRASRFSIPATRRNKQYNGIHPIKRDVFPRKDFSDAKKLVDKYINYGRNSLFKPIVRKTFHNLEHDSGHNEIDKPHNDKFVLHVNDGKTHNAESSLNVFDQNVVHRDDFDKELSKDSIFNHNEPIQSISATTDNKLMNLLDTLEREVKYIELKDKDKEIFDEKIRKIYGKVVGKPVETLRIKIPVPDKYHSINQQDEFLEKLTIRTFTGHPDISDIRELYTDKNDPSFEQFDDQFAANHHDKENKARNRNIYHNNDIESRYRNKNGYRNIEHNGIESHENKYEDFDYNYRKDPYKREHNSRKSIPRHGNRDDYKPSHKNYYLNHEGHDRDPLSTDRRKYYQDKLDNIENRLNRVQNHRRRTVTDDRHMRAILTPHVRKSENQIDSFYIPDRARFLHGY